MDARNDAAAAHGEVIHRITRALEGLRFGAIEIQVHDARVVRITRMEKVRVEDDQPVAAAQQRR